MPTADKDEEKNKTKFERLGLSCSELTSEEIHRVGKGLHLKDGVYPQEKCFCQTSSCFVPQDIRGIVWFMLFKFKDFYIILCFL